MAELLRFDHVGLVTDNLDQEMARMDQLFGPMDWSTCITDPIQKVDIRFGRNSDAMVYELLFPTGPDSPLYQAWRKKKNVLNHICYRTPDLVKGAAHLAESDIRAITQPAPAVAYGQSHIQFFLHPDGWVMELVEGDVSPFDI